MTDSNGQELRFSKMKFTNEGTLDLNTISGAPVTSASSGGGGGGGGCLLR